MSRRNLGGRLERLENGLGGGAVDLEAEAAEYGELQWTRNGTRFYAAQRDGCAALTFVTQDRGALTYEIVGVRPEDLS